ncbi:MAG: Rieske 2Fe-2S domain-containing protein [Corynebacterium sp.]|nr:Rieske 2Fe-2S domain-containing protein [Corynebacterium sp.]
MSSCSRRKFLLASGTTFAAVYLAACGKSGSNAQVPAVEIPVGGAKIVDDVIFAQPTAGEFKAYSTNCPHQNAKITKVEGLEAICLVHMSSFDLRDGSVIQGPTNKSLEEFTATENNGTLGVES